MARIPNGEGLGNLVPQPQRAANMPEGASGVQVGTAIAQGAANALNDMEQAERQRQLELKQEQREAVAARKAADRAEANARMLAAQDNLVLLHDDIAEGIKTGKIAKDKAAEEWSRRSGEMLSTTMEGIPQEHQQTVQAALQHRTNVLSRGVQKAVTHRDQTDTLAGVKQTLEYSQRLYLTNPAAADQLTAETLDKLGPHTGLSSEQLRALGQGWRESTRFNKAYTLVTEARRDNRALDAVTKQLAGEEFADLDPQKRATLMHQVEGFRAVNEQRAETAARRAQAQAEHRLKVGEAEFNAARTLITEGKVLSPEYVQQAGAKMAGTPYAAAFAEIVKEGPKNAAFGSQPLPVMDATINQLRAQLNAKGTDPHIEKQMKQLEQVRDAARRDYKEDPLPAALERGILPQIAPLDVSSLASVTRGLAQRVEQAQLVATRVGEPVSPLLRDEAHKVAQLVSALPVDQRATAIAELAQAAGPAVASAIGRQIAPKDKALGLAFGMAGAKTTQGRYTSELILRGAQAMKDRTIKEDDAKVTGVRAQVATAIGDAYTNDEVRQAMIDAAVLAYYGKSSEGGGDVQEAVRLATGGITERNGKKVPLPYGVTEREFDKKLQGVTAAAFAAQLPDGQVYIDGKPMAAEEFAKKLPQAVLVNAGQGRYAVRAGNSLAATKDGRPLIVEVR